MKLTGRDLEKIRLPLFFSLTLILFSAVLAWWSAGKAEETRHVRNDAAQKKEQTEARLRQVRTEEQELRKRTLIFQQLQTAGITGVEKRLEWIEMLRTLQRELRLPGMTYEFGVQRPLDTPNGTAYTWFASPMRLQLRLLHEEDLLRTLTRIEKAAPALVLVQNCTLTRPGSTFSVQDPLTYLRADCELQWITVQRNGGK